MRRNQTSTNGRPRRGAGGTSERTHSQEPKGNGSAVGTGTSRLLLTLLEHRGTVWSVFLTSVREAQPPVRTLEFEPAGGNEAGVRHSRPLAGELWNALQEGRSLRRSDLTAELELALG